MARFVQVKDDTVINVERIVLIQRYKNLIVIKMTSNSQVILQFKDEKETLKAWYSLESKLRGD